MSSFFAHSFIAVTIYGNKTDKISNQFLNLCWLIWLIIIASFPDLDYVIPSFHVSAKNGLRITHSIAFSLIPAIATLMIFWLLNIRKNRIIIDTLSAILAGCSHLILDLLVGVTPIPLLFPFSEYKFKLPFGILPSAGKIDFSNYYFYRNLFLELGIFLPLLLALYLLKRSRINLLLKTGLLLLLFLCSGYFMHQCYLLPR
jgi:inner membrane protein